MNLQSPSVSTFEVTELFHTLFIQLFSLRNTIVTAVPINENKQCKNAPLYYAQTSVTVLENLETSGKTTQVCNTTIDTVHTY